eukprot:EG_transcript_25896
MAAEATLHLSSTDVPLVYFDMDAGTLGAIKKFPAFADWALAVPSHPEFRVTKVEVENVRWIGQRVDGVRAKVDVQSTSGQVVTQVVDTPEHKELAVVLPVLRRPGGQFLFLERSTFVTPGRRSLVALQGHVAGPRDVVLRDTAALEAIGLHPSPADITPLSPKAFHCSTDGSAEAVRFFCWTIGDRPMTHFPAPYGNHQFVLVGEAEVEEQVFGHAAGKGELRITDANTVLALALYRKLQRG